ncbi:uncharacterized protein J5F26_017033 [Ciconia maguari]
MYKSSERSQDRQRKDMVLCESRMFHVTQNTISQAKLTAKCPGACEDEGATSRIQEHRSSEIQYVIKTMSQDHIRHHRVYPPDQSSMLTWLHISRCQVNSFSTSQGVFAQHGAALQVKLPLGKWTQMPPNNWTALTFSWNFEKEELKKKPELAVDVDPIQGESI